MTNSEIKAIEEIAKEMLAFPALTSHDMAEELAELQNKFHKLLTPEVVIELIERVRSG